ncbi:hypothetical protein B0J14DRAFT_276798 [Halenospora varia]|nr:hypothetical protein B0J14DRAFT_276798 [Halenospora varia]
MSNSASPTASSVPKAGGLCGYQHGNTPCLPEDGQTCCSINGFCGSTEAYCFKTNGCQYGCIEPDVFYSSRAPTLATSTIIVSSTPTPSSSTTSLPTTLATSPTSSSATRSPTPTPTPIAQHGLHGKTKIGVAAGVSAGGVVLLLLVAFLILRWRQGKRTAREKAAREKREAEQLARDKQTRLQQQNGSGPINRTRTPMPGLSGSGTVVHEHE